MNTLSLKNSRDNILHLTEYKIYSLMLKIAIKSLMIYRIKKMLVL